MWRQCDEVDVSQALKSGLGRPPVSSRRSHGVASCTWHRISFDFVFAILNILPYRRHFWMSSAGSPMEKPGPSGMVYLLMQGPHFVFFRVSTPSACKVVLRACPRCQGCSRYPSRLPFRASRDASCNASATRT